VGWVDELASSSDSTRLPLLATEGLTLEPVSAIAEEAARLRAVRELRTPDAIQLATVRLVGAHNSLTKSPARSGRKLDTRNRRDLPPNRHGAGVRS
jgi:hypothetical protein